MMKPLVVALVGVGIAAGAMAAFSEGERGSNRPGGPDIAAIQREVGLTDAQVGQLRKLRQDERKLAIRRRADLQIARMELDELLGAATVDERAVAAMVKALADLQAASLKARIDHRLAVRKVVSAEQLEKMKMLRRQHRHGLRREWRGREGGPGGPRPGRFPGPERRPGAPPPDDESDDEVH